MSPCRRSTPEPARFRAAQSTAASSSSTACTSALGTSVAIDKATAPDPVHRSTTTGTVAVGDGERLFHAPAGQQLGLGARHEDARADGQLEVAEGGGAGEVLERLAQRAAGHERVELVGLPRRDVVDERQLGTRRAEHVRQQLGGVVVGAGDARSSQPPGRLTHQA